MSNVLLFSGSGGAFGAPNKDEPQRAAAPVNDKKNISTIRALPPCYSSMFPGTQPIARWWGNSGRLVVCFFNPEGRTGLGSRPAPEGYARVSTDLLRASTGYRQSRHEFRHRTRPSSR